MGLREIDLLTLGSSIDLSRASILGFKGGHD